MFCVYLQQSYVYIETTLPRSNSSATMLIQSLLKGNEVCYEKNEYGTPMTNRGNTKGDYWFQLIQSNGTCFDGIHKSLVEWSFEQSLIEVRAAFSLLLSTTHPHPNLEDTSCISHTNPLASLSEELHFRLIPKSNAPNMRKICCFDFIEIRHAP